MTYWYYKLGRKQGGPVSAEDLGVLARKGTIKPETLLWHPGLADWVSASEATELSLCFESDMLDKESDPLPDPTIAGPWPRFWARLADEMIIGAVAGLPFGYLIRPHLPEIGVNFPAADNLLTIVMLAAITSIVLWGAMTLFGTTPGKLVAGLRVENRSGMPDWQFYMTREFRIWFFVNTVGVPYLSIIPCILQYRRVAKGGPAWYDEGAAIVRGKGRLSRSAAAAATAAVTFMLTVMAIGYMNMMRAEERMASSYRYWENPATGKKADLWSTWVFGEIKAESGKLYHFTSDKLTSEILFGYEPMDQPSVDAVAYGEALQSVIAEDISVNGKWEPFKLNGFDAARVTGIEPKLKDVNVELTVVIVGRSAWRMLLFVEGRPLTKLAIREVLIHSLLSTAKDINVPASMPCDDETCFSALLSIVRFAPS